MEHEYHTSRRRDQRRAWLPLVAVLGLIVVVFGAILVAFRDDGPAESVGTLPAAFPPLATTTPSPTTTTTATTEAPQPPVVVAPPVTPAPGADAGSDDAAAADARSDDPRRALRQLADDTGASIVTDIVGVGSLRYAMLVGGGDAALYRWDDEAWERDAIVPTPSPVRDIDTTDVTGDGVGDFLLVLAGTRSPGGVYGRDQLGFEMLPFNLTSGQVDWIDDLHVELGRLFSDVDVGRDRETVRWTWTGDQFEVLG